MPGPRLLITNNGPHPAEKWAQVIADEIIVIEPTAPDDAATMNARQLRMNIVTALTPVIEDCQEAERTGRHPTELHADPHVEMLRVVVAKLLAGTPYEEHFKQEHVQARLAGVCGQHLRTVMHIENMHAKDRQEK